MPAIIMHAGAGVLLIIMTNFASYKQNITFKSTKTQNHKSQTKIKQAPSLISTSQTSTTQQSAPKTNIHNRRPAPYNKLTVEMQYFQMRKMHQT